MKVYEGVRDYLPQYAKVRFDLSKVVSLFCFVKFEIVHLGKRYYVLELCNKIKVHTIQGNIFSMWSGRTWCVIVFSIPLPQMGVDLGGM